MALASWQQEPAKTKKLTPSPNPLAIGSTLPDFELKDFQGKPYASEAWSDRKANVIMFFGVECPLVKFYSPRLTELKKAFGDDLRVVAIDSNRQDSLAEIAALAKTLDIKFPILKDTGNVVADALGAQRTPQVFLFDDLGVLRYRGAIDDQYTYGNQKRKVDNSFLADAIKAVIAGKEPRVSTTDSDGCLIGRVMKPNQNATVTYANQISRLLNQHCVSCHREGEIAPFELTEYDEVVGWAEMIAEVTSQQRMPPWHANPAHGEFENDISLTNDQIAMIADWVKAGAPMGDESQLPEPPEFETGWQIGKPDQIIPMSNKPYRVPATGVLDYEHFVIDPGFKEDKWIQAAECRIGNRAVVHHIIVAIKGADGSSLGQIDSEWITATAPGSPPLELKEGYAKLIPAGSKLVFQMHYTPCGVAQSDLSHVGFKFADPKTIKRSVGTREVINRRFRIPPGDPNFRVEAQFPFQDDSLILSLFPHMHVRGKSFRYTVRYPDGKSEILLDIPKYDFNWQNGYKYPEPKLIPAGSVLECVAHYDNSSDNFANPNPNKTVRWGDQTWDEMMIGYFDMALAHQDLSNMENNPRTMSVIGRISSGENLVDDQMIKLAGEATTSKTRMKRFGSYAGSRISNLDRICVTRMVGQQLEVLRVVQRDKIEQQVGGEGQFDLPKDSMFSKILSNDEPTTVADLTQADGKDAEHMSQALRSSYHVPIKIDGQTASINFWSKESNAFPKAVVDVLDELVEAIK
ncbi:MAG: thioredoxin family protein [Planctomycetota bacterium]